MNKQICLASRPSGLPEESNWKLHSEPIPEIKEGEILVEQQYVSLDPAMRGWLKDARSYIPPVAIGDVMRAGTVGTVIKASNNPHFKVGDGISGWGGVQQYTVTNGKGYTKIPAENKRPLTEYLGVLGMPGMTAYFGILEVGEIKKGDVVLISGAAGAVGSLAGQIAKLKGCKVIGICGGAEKCSYVVDELGFDGAIDYKNESIYKSIKKHCPDGIDVYFDNVGGEILDAALASLRMHARVVICGAISQYNTETKPKGPSNYLSLLVNRATMKGMVVFDFASKYGKAVSEITEWIEEGKIKNKESIHSGIENFHSTFLRLFNGKKMGKLLLDVSEK